MRGAHEESSSETKKSQDEKEEVSPNTPGIFPGAPGEQRKKAWAPSNKMVKRSKNPLERGVETKEKKCG